MPIPVRTDGPRDMVMIDVGYDHDLRDQDEIAAAVALVVARGEIDRQTASIPVVALGVTWDVSADALIEPDCVTITGVTVRIGGQVVNGVLCEDAQADIDAGVVGALRETYGRRVVLVSGVDGGGV